MSALTLRDYVEMVLEGYTLHPGARKILDTAIAQELASQTASTNPVVSQKAAGTVDKLALPDDKRLVIVDDTFANLIFWVERAVNKGNANMDIEEAFEQFTGYEYWEPKP